MWGGVPIGEEEVCMEVRERLARLREVMREEGLAGYVVHDADPHLSEYPPDHWKVGSYFSGWRDRRGYW